MIRGLAANPNLDADDLRNLAASPDPLVLAVLAQRADLTPDVALRLAHDAEAVVDLARNRAVAAHVWPKLINHPDPLVRRRLAEHVPQPGMRILADDTDMLVRRYLTGRDDLPDDLIRHLATDREVHVRRGIAGHRRRPGTLLLDPDGEVRSNALRCGEPPPGMLATLLSDPVTRAAAARYLSEPAGLLTDGDPAVREALAGNDRLPYATVQALSGDPDEDVRAAMMLRKDLPDTVRAAVAATVAPQDHHVAGWLLPAAAPLHERLAHVTSPFVFCRRAVAFSTDLNADAIARLAGDDDHSVRLLLALHSVGVPGRILPGLLLHAGHDRWEFARHPNMPAEALAVFADADDDELRQVAATGRNLPAASAAALTRHPDPLTRRYAAANPALPLPVLLDLLNGSDPDLADAAASNPALPHTVARRLLTASITAVDRTGL